MHLYLLLGLVLSLSQGVVLPVDGSGRILITDIGYSEDSSLWCSSLDVGTHESAWYLHPSRRSIADGDMIHSSGEADRGWQENRYYNGLRLRRDSVTIAEEGVLTCNIVGDSNTPVSVGVYYHSESMTTNRDLYHYD